MDDLDYFQAWLYSFTIVAGHEVLVLSLNQRLTKVSFKVDEFQKFFLSLFLKVKIMIYKYGKIKKVQENFFKVKILKLAGKKEQ